MAAQTVDSIQLEDISDRRIMERAENLARPEQTEVSINEPVGEKKVHWRKWLIIAAAVVALIVIAVLIVLVIIQRIDDSDSADTEDQTMAITPTTPTTTTPFGTDVALSEGKKDQICTNLPPGIMQMTSGVRVLDINIDPLSIDESGDALTCQIIALTCKEGKKFVDQNGNHWDLPDQMAYIENLYTGQTDISTFVFSQTKDLDNHFGAQGGLKFEGKNFLTKIMGHLQGKGSWKHYKDKISKENETIVKTFVFVGSYRGVFKSFEGLQFQSDVMKVFDKLPKCQVVEDCIDPYMEFINFHGTHYYALASFGGHVSAYHEMTSSYSRNASGTQIQASAKASLLGVIDVHGGVNIHTSKSTEDFNKNSKSVVSFRGGLEKYYTNISAWRASVLDHPVLYEHVLAPIYFIVDQNDPRREIMKQSLEKYIDEQIGAQNTDANE